MIDDDGAVGMKSELLADNKPHALVEYKTRTLNPLE